MFIKIYFKIGRFGKQYEKVTFARFKTNTRHSISEALDSCILFTSALLTGYER